MANPNVFVPSKPEKVTETQQTQQTQVETKDDSLDVIAKASGWLSQQIRTIREWKGTDGRMYASIGHSNANPNNGIHNSPLDVAEELLTFMKEKAANSADQSRAFISFNLRYDNKNVEARLISVDRPGNRLIAALDIDYSINGAKAGILSFNRKQSSSEPAAAQVPDAGFGKLL